MEMETLDDRASYWVGFALMDIGKGRGLRNAFALALMGERKRAFEHGKAEGLREARDKKKRGPNA